MNQQILEQKKQVVEEIANKIQNAGSTVVVEYRGLTVQEITELRRSLREENIELDVYKNTLVRFATDKLGYNAIDETLVGPNAYAFGEDQVAASRILCKFAKKHDKLVVKSGIVDNQVLDAAQIAELAKLPNKEGMISMLLGCLQSPIRSFAATVKAIADEQTEAN